MMELICKTDLLLAIAGLPDGANKKDILQVIYDMPVSLEIMSPHKDKEEKQVQEAISGMLDRKAAFDATMEVIAANTNIEYRHIAADAVMCDLLEVLGFGRGVNRYRHMERWYS